MSNKFDKIHRFSDFIDSEEHVLDGDKVKIDTLLDKSIIILNFKVRTSKYKDKNPQYITVQFREENSNVPKIFFSGSTVIIDLLNKYKDKVPFITIIKKINKYYTLT